MQTTGVFGVGGGDRAVESRFASPRRFNLPAILNRDGLGETVRNVGGAHSNAVAQSDGFP
jgi:hypothetical protein